MISTEKKLQLIKHPTRPILLIEDNYMDVDLTTQAFIDNGVTNPVIVCRDGEEALSFINSHKSVENIDFPQLVLLDLRLPKVDGLDILAEARKIPAWKKIPFVIMTTSQEISDMNSAYDLGANSYVVKPIDFDSFADVIKNIQVYWLFTNVSPISEMKM
ncbi:MAG: response regulator [Prolixibacteraceae bacterium]|jgi:CheY-like chemotaxis protein|nr:response regulator [Prolixibacteraceae bacterium]MBT6004880.1 response regulator [Prolixibacteraceae bacterium]MBT6764369.1 response regulator [Prolixibacteraceae bacterium]MBT7000632.1 response regulator [Prolixibacteraceae bacterium]MBT7396199.1 response regulator [Prolixibacteraceae bacterium]